MVQDNLDYSLDISEILVTKLKNMGDSYQTTMD